MNLTLLSQKVKNSQKGIKQLRGTVPCCLTKFLKVLIFTSLSQYYHRLSEKVNEQRDKAEDERRRELRRGFDREKEGALQEQWEECERLKEEAIKEAYELAIGDMRSNFDREKEKAVSAALQEARVNIMRM